MSAIVLDGADELVVPRREKLKMKICIHHLFNFICFVSSINNIVHIIVVA